MNVKLSMIIPFFNVDKYISECIDSVYSQDIPENVFEVICVDDFSTDNSKEIIFEYQKKHSNLILLEHDRNKMLGAARNTGLRAASGEFVWFIDSDDCIKPNILSFILDTLYKDNPDIIYFEYSQNYNNVLESKIPSNKSIIYRGADFLECNYLSSRAIFTAWSKIIRTKLLIHHNAWFCEDVYFEDAENIIRALYYANDIIYINQPLYYYRRNEASIMNSSFSGKKYADMIKLGARKLLFSDEIKQVSPILAKIIKQDAIWNATAIKRIIYLKNTERISFYKELKNHQFDSIKQESDSLYLRFLFFYPRTVIAMLFLISPILTFIKQLKNKISCNPAKMD